MAKMTKAQREWRPGQPKKPRSTRVMFASTVLTLEAFLAIFVTLSVFGMNRETASPAVVLGAGAAIAVLCILTCALLKKPLGYAIGWALQLLFILTGFLDAGDVLRRWRVRRHLVVCGHQGTFHGPGDRPAGARAGSLGRRAPGGRHLARAPPNRRINTEDNLAPPRPKEPQPWPLNAP